MKKFIPAFCIVLLVFFITNCQNERKEKLTGVWKLDVMNINHTAIKGTSLGNWLWEFNEEGGYLINVAGEVEKGIYKLDEDKLTLQSVTHKERPDWIFTITKLDSANLDLDAVSDKNTSTLSFVKLKGEDVVEKD